MNDQPTHEQITGISVTRIEAFGPHSEEFIKHLPPSIQEQIKSSEHVAHLAQLLGVSLRDILPYAINERDALGDHKDGSPEAEEEYEVASVKISRAEQALNILNASSLSVENLPNDTFDDEFRIKFDEE